jgi:hypothetical protein
VTRTENDTFFFIFTRHSMLDTHSSSLDTLYSSLGSFPSTLITFPLHSFFFKRKHPLPIFLHAHQCPAALGHFVEAAVEFAGSRCAVVCELARAIVVKMS